MTLSVRREAALREQLETKQKSRSLADTLTAKYREGVGILNTPIGDVEDLHEFKQATSKWLTEVVTFMRERKCTEQELAHVEVLHKIPTNLGLHPDVVVNHKKSMHWVRLDRVKAVINSHASTPILMDE